MTDNFTNALDQAAKRLRAGDQRTARTILVQVLREDPENAQAWYMLSFAVPVVEKQIYALQQALRFRPGSQKALARLQQLGGELLPAEEEPATPPPSQPAQSAPQPTPDHEQDNGDELLTRRLFGGPDPTPEAAQTETTEPAQEIETPEPEETVPPVKKRRRRWPLIVALLLLIALVIAGALFQQSLMNWLASALPGSQPAATAIEDAMPDTDSAAEPDPTATLLPTPVPPTPTPIPTATPVLFRTENLSPPDPDTASLFDQIQTEMLDLLGLDTAQPVQSFDVVEPQLQSYMYEIGQLPDFAAQAEHAAALYQALGLASESDDLNTFLINTWVDPNGTLLLPGKDTVITVGINFSLFQQYSYAAAYAQAVRQQESPSLPEFPCFSPTETCDSYAAVVKGGAFFTASRWADLVLSPAEASTLESASRKYYFVPVVPPPSPLMDALRRFPYQSGQELAEAVFQSGGQSALNQLYLDLPATTEQILHPEKYLAGELPADLETVDLAGVLPDEWENIFQGPLGEWRTFLLLAYHRDPLLRVEEDTSSQAAAGWNGDHAQVFTDPTGQPAFVLHWQWDNQNEADQFNTTLEDYINRRVGGVDVQIGGFDCVRSTLAASCLVVIEQQTIWLLAPDQDTLEILLNAYLPE